MIRCALYTAQIWDLASGTLKLSLTGHVSTVRGVAVSPRQPYLFSAGEDKQVKCWDLEYNKVWFFSLSSVLFWVKVNWFSLVLSLSVHVNIGQSVSSAVHCLLPWDKWFPMSVGMQIIDLLTDPVQGNLSAESSVAIFLQSCDFYHRRFISSAFQCP